MDAIGIIQGVLELVNKIREAAENVKSVPQNAQKLAKQAERFRRRLELLEVHEELHDRIEEYIGGVRFELEEVYIFLQALEGKKPIKRWMENKSIKAAFEDWHQRLQDCRDELNADIIAFLAAQTRTGNNLEINADIASFVSQVDDFQEDPQEDIDEDELDTRKNKELRRTLNAGFRFRGGFRSKTARWKATSKGMAILRRPPCNRQGSHTRKFDRSENGRTTCDLKKCACSCRLCKRAIHSLSIYSKLLDSPVWRSFLQR